MPQPLLGAVVVDESVLAPPPRGDEQRDRHGSTLEVADQVDGVEVIDVLPWVCPRQTCWPVIGEVLVYRQGSHVTATYARSMSEVIVQGMEPLLTS